MNSLKEVYAGIRQADHEKVAAVRAAQGLPPQVDLSQVPPELLKMAQDYDRIGRILAHNVFADMIKQAMDEAGVPEEKKKEELEAAMAKARGEEPAKKDDDKSDDKDKKPDEGAKKEAAKKAIMARMAKDPKYTSKLIAKHMDKKPAGR